MRKLTLSLNDLAVESFDTNADAATAVGTGTVKANIEDPAATAGPYSCQWTCDQTCNNTCPWTCMETCGVYPCANTYVENVCTALVPTGPNVVYCTWNGCTDNGTQGQWCPK